MSDTPTSSSGPARPAAAQPPRLPLLLLGLLTLATMGGPFLILLAIRGGPRPEWPPDRPVEWWTLIGVTSVVVVLMAACLTSGLWARPGPSSKP